MVFSANGAVVEGGRALTARFRHRERAREQLPYRQWFVEREFREVRSARAICEGEGDVVFVGSIALAGWGFRSTRSAHHEVQEFFGRPVVSLRLCDPRFYHLDMALCALDERTIAYFPPAFSAGSRLRARPAVPGRGPGGRIRRLCARPQRGERRPPRRAADGGAGDARARACPWVRAGSRRDVGVRQGRWGRQVLHAGDAVTGDLLTGVSPTDAAASAYCAPTTTRSR